MNENLDLTEILKDAPKGTKLWSPICGECELIRINYVGTIYPIICQAIYKNGHNIYERFTANGRLVSFYDKAECVLFPSKENRDWATFQVPKPRKHFEPFQKVLFSVDYGFCHKTWAADFFSHYNENSQRYYLVSGYEVEEDEIIPYEGNEDKLGKPVEE